MICGNSFFSIHVFEELIVSELSNEPSIQPEDSEESGNTPSHSGTMLVTMLLLIAGFSLSSFMLFYYGVKAGNTDGTQRKLFDFAALKEKGAAYTAQLKSPDKPESGDHADPGAAATDQKKSEGLKLFSSKNNGKVRWPKMKLTGFGTSSDGTEGFAIINGKQFHPGQLIDGKAKLVEVRSQDVVLEYMGETRTLTVDIKKN